MFSSTFLYEPAENLATQPVSVEMIMDETGSRVVAGYILQESNSRPVLDRQYYAGLLI
jgi:hypothetical protein